MFLPLKDPFSAILNERGASTWIKFVAKLGIMMQNSSKTFQTFWLHFSVFALEKQAKNLNFRCVFICKRPFGGYIQ